MYVCMYVLCMYVSLIGSKRSKYSRLSFRIHTICSNRDTEITKLSSAFHKASFISTIFVEVTPIPT
jgi:hypothetical protein